MIKISKNGKVMFAKPYKSRVLSYDIVAKDWFMTNYHLTMSYMGNYLKWHQKLALWTFCKTEDLKCLIVNGFRQIFRR